MSFDTPKQACGEQKTFEVQVGGLTLKLKSSHDRETVSQLIALVNAKIDGAEKAHPQISYQKALLLTCLHLAEELVLLKRGLSFELDQVERQVQQIFIELESSPLNRLRVDS